MIVLDTNVLSELMREHPDANVMAWLDNESSHNLFITAITVAEILYGINRLPKGQRKTRIQRAAESVFDEDFMNAILAFDQMAASHYADIVSTRERNGRPISMADAQIAAICRSHSAKLATRNEKDFEGTGVAVLNPWKL